MRSFDVYTRPLWRSTDFSGPQTAVLFVVFLIIEAEHASARRLSLPVAIVAEVAGIAAGWWTLPR